MLHGLIGYFSERLRAWAGADGGSTMLTFAIAFPVLLGGVAIAVHYSQMISVRSAMQNAADAAAMGGAKEIVVANMSDSQIVSSTQAMAQSIVLPVLASAGATPPTINVTIGNNRTTVAVTISATLTNKLASTVGVFSEQIGARATASLNGRTQLCLLTLDPTDGGALTMDTTAQVTAPQCSAYSNSSNPSGLQVTGSAVLTSGRTCTVGGYTGNAANYSPLPITGCPNHPDPLTGIVPPTFATSGCLANQKITGGSASTLSSASCYTGTLEIGGSAQVTLAGVYNFQNVTMKVTGSATITSPSGATLYFHGTTGSFTADPATTIDLTASKSGAFAGVLIYEDPTASTGQVFEIKSNTAHNLLGTIYLPQGQLKIDGNGSVADSSAYTVIVARMLTVTSSANLHLNAMYTNSDVPVPSGVGPSGGNVALTQ